MIKTSEEVNVCALVLTNSKETVFTIEFAISGSLLK